MMLASAVSFLSTSIYFRCAVVFAAFPEETEGKSKIQSGIKYTHARSHVDTLPKMFIAKCSNFVQVSLRNNSYSEEL